jgi:hypothetical protein
MISLIKHGVGKLTSDNIEYGEWSEPKLVYRLFWSAQSQGWQKTANRYLLKIYKEYLQQVGNDAKLVFAGIPQQCNQFYSYYYAILTPGEDLFLIKTDAVVSGDHHFSAVN